MTVEAAVPPRGSSGTEAIPASVCLEQLARILRGPDFDATERGRKFLAYVVRETLEGRAERIKAYSIAVEVFGRDASFNPQADPIVRMEAGQLRRSLERYYLKAGRADPAVLTIPKGHYVPVFEINSSRGGSSPIGEEPAAVEKTGTKRAKWRSWQAPAVVAALAIGLAVLAAVFLVTAQKPIDPGPALPRVLVLPIEDLNGSPASAASAQRLTAELFSQLSKFKELLVIERETGSQRVNGGETPGADGQLRFTLAGSVELAQDRLTVRVRVIDNLERSIIWANSFKRNLSSPDSASTEANIASQIAMTLGQPYGVIFQADAARHVENPASGWNAYSCTLAYYEYRNNLDGKMHPAIRHCLEEAVTQFPAYATAWALLSQTYVDEIRFRYPSEPGASNSAIGRALAAARRAVELDPQDIRARQAEMLALFVNGDMDAAFLVAEQALGLNPNDTEFMGEFGFRLAMAGNWDRGCALLSTAREKNPGPLAYFEAALALCAWSRGDYGQAAMWIKKTTAPPNPNYHIIAAAIYGAGGYTEDAARERDWLVNNAPGLLQNVRREVAARFLRRDDAGRFIASLAKAGLVMPAQ